MNCPKCHTDNAAAALFCSRCGSQLPADDRTDAPSLGNLPTLRPAGQSRRCKTGEKVLGRYRIQGELGQGGMGVVYKCFDEIGGIEVALKALPPELSHNSVEMEEVRENFQLVARLVHQHIAAVRTLDRDAETGDYYLILELAEGLDLRRWRKQKGGKASLEDVLPILRHVAEALDYAHTRKIIHRDVKPANVMVAPDGTVKVLDFGLAAQIQTSLSRVSQVKYGTSGTGPYMAPEQWRGQYQDGASDQYALAVLAYELLSGHLPFESHDPVVLKQAVLDNVPERPGALDAAGWAALARGLAKERAARFGTCGELGLIRIDIPATSGSMVPWLRIEVLVPPPHWVLYPMTAPELVLPPWLLPPRMVIPAPIVSVMLLALAIRPWYSWFWNTTVPVPPKVWLAVSKEIRANEPSVAVPLSVRPLSTCTVALLAVRSRSQLAVTPSSVPPLPVNTKPAA